MVADHPKKREGGPRSKMREQMRLQLNREPLMPISLLQNRKQPLKPTNQLRRVLHRTKIRVQTQVRIAELSVVRLKIPEPRWLCFSCFICV